MLASEYINTISFGILRGFNNYSTVESMEEAYDNEMFTIPRIFCNDGFNISVQVNRANYGGSENGIRKFGLDWKLVEWGYPSSEIDGEKFNAEDTDNTKKTVGAYVEVGLIDELCESHGGVDLLTTLKNGMY